jgi:aminopeptidase N
MKKFSALLACLWVIVSLVSVSAQDDSAPSAGAIGAGDIYYPELGNGGYDALHYTLDVTVDVEDNFINSIATIALQATQNLTAFNVELIGLDIESITIDGVSAEFERNDREMTITPAEPLANGQDYTLVIVYSGGPFAQKNESLRNFFRPDPFHLYSQPPSGHAQTTPFALLHLLP